MAPKTIPRLSCPKSIMRLQVLHLHTSFRRVSMPSSISESAFQRLPKNVQEVILEAGKMAQDQRSRQLWAERWLRLSRS